MFSGMDSRRRHQRLLRTYQSRLDAPACPHGQGGAAEMAEGRLCGKSKSVPHGGGHTARWHYLAHAGESDLGRTGAIAGPTLPKPEVARWQTLASEGQPRPLCGRLHYHRPLARVVAEGSPSLGGAVLERPRARA